MKSENFYKYLFVAGVFFILISRNFLSRGMFVDGLYYATISRNMSEGIGTFLCPQLTMTFESEFLGHPPLAFGLESLFFKLGNSLLIAKFYSVFTCIIVSFLMFFIWKICGGKQKNFWFVLLLWISTPLVFWSATNNLLENTMAVFVCTSVLFYLLSIKKKSVVDVSLSGFCLTLAILSKGFTGLYPLVMPFLFWLIFRTLKFKKAVIDTLILAISCVLPLLILFVYSSDALNYAQQYMNMQIFDSLQIWKTVESRFFILNKFFSHAIVPIIIALVVVFLGFFSNEKTFQNFDFDNLTIKYSIFFFVLSLCGVVPIMISLKQSDFYILTIFPFVALSLGLIVQPIVDNVKIKQSIKFIPKLLSILIFVVAIILNVLNFDKIVRDKEILSDIDEISQIIPDYSTISVEESLFTEFSTIGYLYFCKHISIANNEDNEYLLCPVSQDCAPQNYSLVMKLTKYNLYRKEDFSN